jgi:hypothetical protein
MENNILKGQLYREMVLELYEEKKTMDRIASYHSI